MVIEYKIKFDKDGVTITQNVEPKASTETVKQSAAGPIAVKQQLPESFPQTKMAAAAVGAAGGGGDRTGTGTGGGDRTGTGGGGGDPTGTGTGGGDRTGTGTGGGDRAGATTGGAGSGRVIGIVFGPIVILDGVPIANRDAVGPAGGGGDRTSVPN